MILVGLSLLLLANGSPALARGCGGCRGIGGFGGRGFADRGFADKSIDRGFGDRGFGNRNLVERGFEDRGFDEHGPDANFGRPGFDNGIREFGDRGLGDRGPEAPANFSGAGREPLAGRMGDLNRPLSPGGFDRISGIGNRVFSGNHLHNYSPTWINNHGNLVRNNFYGYNHFWGRDWWRYHPWGWYYPGWGAWGGWNAAWLTTDWVTLAAMLGMAATTMPQEYDYGSNVTYNDNEVYYGNQPYATTDQYYQQAQTLAQSTTNTSKPTRSETWKPLGVFSLVQGEQVDSTTLLQFAINPKGDIAGNYLDMLSDQGQQIHGKLDKKTQRIAWTVGGNKNVVYDTGLANLLSAQAPVLVHFGKDRTEQFLLVRLKSPEGEQPPSTPASSAQPQKG